MGNEMGNRNVSGLQEEDNTTVEAPEKSLREAVEVDDLKGENQIVPAAEGKDYHEKVAGLASDDPLGAGDRPHVDNQTSDEKEQDESEIQVPADGSPEVQVESNNASGDGSGIQPVSSSENVSDHEKPVDSKLEENLLEQNDHKIQKLKTVKRETTTEEEEVRNPTFDTKSATDEPEPLELVDPKSDQDQLGKIHADPSVEDHSGSLQESEEILGLNLTCDSEEKDHQLLDTEITQNLAENVVSSANPEADERRVGDFQVEEMESQEEKMFDRSFCEEKFEITDGDEVGNGMDKLTTKVSKFSSDSENKCGEEFLTEMNINRNDSLDSQSEAILQANSVNFCEEVVPEPKDKCMVLTEETKLVESESEVNKHDHNPTEFCEESVIESKTENVNASQSEFMMIGFRYENEGKGSLVESSCNSEINEAEKVAENGYRVDLCHKNTNLDSEGGCKDLVEGTEIVSENGKVPMELTATERNNEGEEPIEKKIIEEIEEKKEDENGMRDDDAGREVAEQFVSQSLPIEQAQVVLSPSPVSPALSQDHEQDTAMGSETIEDSSMSNADSKQESCSEFFVTKVLSTIDSTKSIVETVVSAVELESEKPQQDPSQCVEKTPRAVAETEVSANQSNALCEESEKSVLASGGFEAQESMGRLSTESSPENLNIPLQIQKSPSFNFDLLIEATTEESDQTPLLYKEKTATGSLSSQVGVEARSPVAETEYSLEPLQYQAMSVEEKANKLERGDSEKSRTPFLSLMKEDEEAHIVVMPQKKDGLGSAVKAPEELWNSPAMELGSISPKRKEKRKPRSSLFSNCLCCAAMIN